MRTKFKYDFKYSAIGFIFLLHAVFLPAQKFLLKLSKDTISFYDTVTLTLSGETNNLYLIKQLNIPDGLAVIKTSDFYSTTKKGTYAITYSFVLQPVEIGVFNIGPASVQIGGNRFFSNKTQLVVNSGDKNLIGDNIFIRCDVNKKKAIVGEEIVLSLRLYNSGLEFAPNNDEGLTSIPSFGFWSKDVPIDSSAKDSITTIKGRRFKILTFYQKIIYPNTSGILTIPSYKISGSVSQAMFSTGDPFIDDLMGMATPIQLNSLPISIEVSPVPDNNRPIGFAGDVGEFSISSEIDRTQVKANEPVVLKIKVAGKGNIELVQLPDLKFPDGIEFFPPTSEDSVNVTSTGITGEKTFSITIIPKKEGQYKLPGINFSYYDPGKKEYVTISTPEFSLDVKPGDPNVEVSENNLPESFLDVKSYRRIVMRILLIAVPALLLMVMLYFRSRKKKKEDEEIVIAEKIKEEIANEELPVEKNRPDIHGMINVAERFFMNGNTKAGISQLYETLLTAICFKTEISREEASINQLNYRLRLKKFDPVLIEETLAFLQYLSESRYSDLPISAVKLAENLQISRKLATRLS